MLLNSDGEKQEKRTEEKSSEWGNRKRCLRKMAEEKKQQIGTL